MRVIHLIDKCYFFPPDKWNESLDPEPVEDSTVDLYRWYASILNRTAVLLESPERDFSRLDQHGQSVLHYAINSGTNSITHSLWSGFYLSTLSGSVEMIEYLIENFGRELSLNQNDKNGFSCVHKAVTRGDSNMVRFLMKKGVNINVLAGSSVLAASFTLDLFGRLFRKTSAITIAYCCKDGTSLYDENAYRSRYKRNLYFYLYEL